MNKKTIFIVISLLFSVFALAGCTNESVEPLADQITPSIQPTQNNLVREKSGPGGICGGIAGWICADGLTCRIEGNYPDAAGSCEKSGFLKSSSIFPPSDGIECIMTPDCALGFDIVDQGIDENGCQVYGCENNTDFSSE